MSAASDFELDTEFPGAEDGGLDVGLGRGRDDEDWFASRGGVEARVADVCYES